MSFRVKKDFAYLYIRDKEELFICKFAPLVSPVIKGAWSSAQLRVLTDGHLAVIAL